MPWIKENDWRNGRTRIIREIKRSWNPETLELFFEQSWYLRKKNVIELTKYLVRYERTSNFVWCQNFVSLLKFRYIFYFRMMLYPLMQIYRKKMQVSTWKSNICKIILRAVFPVLRSIRRFIVQFDFCQVSYLLHFYSATFWLHHHP